MTAQKDPQSPRFMCQRVTVHFIYSFVLRKEDSGIVVPRELCQALTEARMGRPESRNGIAPRLALQLDSAFVEGDSLQGSVLVPEDVGINERPAQLDQLVRLFLGGGAYTLSLEIRDDAGPLTTADIQAALRLMRLRTRRTPDSKVRLRLTSQGETIQSVYTLFQKMVNTVCDTTPFYWMDNKDGFLGPGGSLGPGESQSPWVITIAEVAGDVADVFCDTYANEADPKMAKRNAVKRYRHEIAPILYRSVSDRLDLEPAYSPFFLDSINLDARLFVSMSRRSVFCACRNKNEDPALYFMPDLLDIAEVIRARWHMLIILNKALDRTLRNMVEEMRKGSSYPARGIRDIIQLREWLATGLQDPGIYIFAGDALSNIYEQMRRTFQLGELTDLVLHKIALVEKMYSDVLQLDWMKASPRNLEG